MQQLLRQPLPLPQNDNLPHGPLLEEPNPDDRLRFKPCAVLLWEKYPVAYEGGKDLSTVILEFIANADNNNLWCGAVPMLAEFSRHDPF